MQGRKSQIGMNVKHSTCIYAKRYKSNLGVILTKGIKIKIEREREREREREISGSFLMN